MDRQKELNDIAEVLQRLAKNRNRFDKDPLTRQQRLEMLNRIYDGALHWLEGAVITAKSNGIGAATQVLERSRLEAIELERTGFGASESDSSKKQAFWHNWGPHEKRQTETEA